MVPSTINGGGIYHFVTYMGAPVTDPKVKKLAKRDVMKHVHRSRKNTLAARRQKPLLCELDVPQEFGEGRADFSGRLDLGNFQSILAPPGV